MKIVIFGPERLLGALVDDCVIDLNRGFCWVFAGTRRSQIGDVIEVSSPQIGALSNRIVISESE